MKAISSIFFIVLAMFSAVATKAQYESIRQEGEYGISVGASHYFGDLNTISRLNRPKIAAGIFYRKQFGNYVAARINVHYAQLGYSDKYNTKNAFQLNRNLSFGTDVFELALQGDFNFIKFLPSDPDYRFTPYVTLGVGLFNYDPYAYFGGSKYFLRPLGTEGQGSDLYPNLQPYGTMALCFPFGVGVKWAMSSKVNLGFEIVHRFTNTDYLDDVSTTYADPLAFQNNSIGFALQDRSLTGSAIPGSQRGFEKQKDQYIFAEFTLAFNLTSYRCPTAK